MSDYDELLTDLQDELGGFGPKTVESIRETFEYDEFLAALRTAYLDRDTEELEQIHGVSTGYGLKLARWYGRREQDRHAVDLDIGGEVRFSGAGDAEPQEIGVRRASDLFG